MWQTPRGVLLSASDLNDEMVSRELALGGRRSATCILLARGSRLRARCVSLA